MDRFLKRPLYILIAYLVVILLFAVLYRLSPTGTFVNDLNSLESIYFSVITITTLGYGDIAPVSEFGMIVTSAESILGIVVIGIFINASWRGLSERLDERQSEKINASLRSSNKNNLLSYYLYLSRVIAEYKSANIELTTPIQDRAKKDEFVFDFKFSDLRDLFGRYLSLKYGLENSVIEVYYRIEGELDKELKYVLANFGLEDFDQLRNSMVEFLTVVHTTKVKEALLSYAALYAVSAYGTDLVLV